MFLFCLTLFVRAEEVVKTNSPSANPELFALPVYPSVEEEAQKTAVVYNEKYEPSVRIARHYQKVRGIPEKNMITVLQNLRSDAKIIIDYSTNITRY